MIIVMDKKLNRISENNNKSILYYSCIFTFICVMVAHGFAFFNFYPGHDAIRHSFYFAGKWEVSLSRFLLPYYGFIKGSIAVPWITGILTAIFLGLATFFICDILEIYNSKCIFIVSAVLGTNLCVTELCRVFTFVLDAYMLSMMFACMGVWIIKKNNNITGILVSILCFTLSMGLYSGMIPVAVVLFIFIVIKDSLNNHKLKDKLEKRYLLYLVSLIASGLMFLLLSKMFMRIWKVEPAQSYNSLSALKSLGIKELIFYIKQNYLFWFRFYFGKANPVSDFIAIFNIILLLICILRIIQLLRYKKISILNYIVSTIFVIIVPGVSMFINILMQRIENNFYCNFGLFMFYIPIVMVINNIISKEHNIKVKKGVYTIAGICFVFIFWTNIIYSNGAYTVQKVLYDRAVSDMTRILYDIEADEQFDLNSTEVVFIRDGEEYIKSPTSDYDTIAGGKKIAFSTNNSIKYFIELIGDPIIVVNDNNIINKYKEMGTVKDMPSFPQKGYFKILDGKMIVKIRNT